MTLLIRLLSVLVISTSLFVAGCSSGGSSAGFDKEDTDGDGIADIYDPDIDGDGIPNGQDPDIDGDGIPNDQDPDMDGDGKPNGTDPDPENNDPNYCDRIQVFGLNDEQTTGEEIPLTWEFFNSKVGSNGECTLKDGVKAGLAQITASAVGATDEKSGETNPLDNDEVTIKIPHTCVQGATVEVTYDFTEFATLIKADPNAPGWTVKQDHKADPEECDTDGDGLPNFGLQCPAEATGDYPSCSCPDGEEYEAETNSCEVAAVECPPAGNYPSCSGEGASFGVFVTDKNDPDEQKRARDMAILDAEWGYDDYCDGFGYEQVTYDGWGGGINDDVWFYTITGYKNVPEECEAN